MVAIVRDLIRGRKLTGLPGGLRAWMMTPWLRDEARAHDNSGGPSAEPGSEPGRRAGRARGARSVGAFLFSCLFSTTLTAQSGPVYATPETREVVERMIDAHGGLEEWRAAPSVSYDNIFFNPMAPADSWWVSHEVTQQNTRRTYQHWPLDGAVLAFDGETTWTDGWRRANNPKFMVHFFFYFVNLPWITQDPGVVLGAPQRAPLPGDETEYITIEMTFSDAPTVGKTKDDSFKLYVDPETYLLKGYEYTIGWGPMLDGMQVPEGQLFGPTLRVHDRFSTVDGLVVPAVMRTISGDGSQVFGHHTILNPSFSQAFDEGRLVQTPTAVVDTVGGERRPRSGPSAAREPTPPQFPQLSADVSPFSGAVESCGYPDVEVSVRCGILRVPVNYEDRGGSTIDLAFVILSGTETPEDDPVFLLPGGPGDPPTFFLGPGFLERFDETLRSRELIVMDPRGTGRSGAMTCAAGEGPPPVVETSFPTALVDACLERWRAQTDLSQFSSESIVRDFESLRKWLGYDQVNLSAYSYGTRLAQVYIRDAPSAVRSAVLNSVVPLNSSAYASMGRTLEGVLREVVAGCAADALCAEEFPELESAVAETMERAERGFEVSVRFDDGTYPIWFDAPRFAASLRVMLAGQPLDVPRAVSQAHEGDWSEIVRGYANRLRGIWGAYPLAHHFAVLCPEDIEIVADPAGGEESADYGLGGEIFGSYVRACGRFPEGSKRPAVNWEPVSSDLPVLLVSGQYDPATPPAHAEGVAARLRNSRHLVFPREGHIVTGACVGSIEAAFYEARSTRELDISCLADEPLEPFVARESG